MSASVSCGLPEWLDPFEKNYIFTPKNLRHLSDYGQVFDILP